MILECSSGLNLGAKVGDGLVSGFARDPGAIRNVANPHQVPVAVLVAIW